MKTFKVYYDYKEINNAYKNIIQNDFMFIKASNKKMAMNLFLNEFKDNTTLSIFNVEIELL